MLLFLFWPVFGVRYLLIENLNPAVAYTVVYCPLDDWIPFQEAFVIPYVFWYVFIIGMHLYTMLYDIPAFKRYTKFMLIAFSVSTLTFLLFPTCQNLRPAEFPRDNLLTKIVAFLYNADTNTNVCPSEHVIGSVGALAAAVDTKRLRTPRRMAMITVAAMFTSIATVFLKQHSVVDVLAALPVCAVVWLICYGRKKE